MNNKEVIAAAIKKGAVLFGSVSGGKDGQAMVNVLVEQDMPPIALVHADLGSMEWPQSMEMCRKQAARYLLPLVVVRRHDGKGLLEHMRARMLKLMGRNIPFWPSSASRYCTSDTKREPINKYLRNCGEDFVISCEGIRAEESSGRAKKNPLTIRENITSTYYKGMTVEEAIAAYKPGKRLALTWFPIFNYTLDEVWGTENTNAYELDLARHYYKELGVVQIWWPFHPAYVFGNDRVNCMFCVLGSPNDLQVAADHNPELLDELIEMQEESGFTFKNKFSLTALSRR